MTNKISAWDVFHNETLSGTESNITSHRYDIASSTLLHKFKDGSGVVLYQEHTGAAMGLTLDIEEVLANENSDTETIKLLNRLTSSGFLTNINSHN
ncbi:MAG: hypothetical protein HRT37_13450 [Alteromonadaceae bacterium]|nr:hypothetical protein [Alteromonadaceae bacterium]